MARLPIGWLRLGLSTVAVAAALTGCQATGPTPFTGRPLPTIRYTDVGDPSRFPLTIGSEFSIGIGSAPPSKPYTASIILFNVHGQAAHLVRMVPIAHSANLVVLGTSAAGADRHLGEAGGGHGYPPVVPRGARTNYRPIGTVPVPPEPGPHRHGVDVLIGVEYRTGHGAWFDGLRVTYTVGARTYVGDFPTSWAMCDHQPCPAPQTGSPWVGP